MISKRCFLPSGSLLPEAAVVLRRGGQRRGETERQTHAHLPHRVCALGGQRGEDAALSTAAPPPSVLACAREPVRAPVSCNVVASRRARAPRLQVCARHFFTRCPFARRTAVVALCRLPTPINSTRCRTPNAPPLTSSHFRPVRRSSCDCQAFVRERPQLHARAVSNTCSAARARLLAARCARFYFDRRVGRRSGSVARH